MNPPKMPIHIGDYQRDTGHLRAAEHGAYLLLMFHYWSTGGLPDNDDHLSAIARITRPEWARSKDTLRAFFKDGWKHPRIDYDLDKARNISDAAREAGKASGRSRSVKQTLNGRSLSVEPTLEPLNQTKKDSADAVSSKYAFESGTIKLNQRDFDRWKAAFSHLDLAAELVAMTPWAETLGPNWFHAVPNALAKRNREALATKSREAPAPFKWNGIEGVI